MLATTEIVVTEDGQEALVHLFGPGAGGGQSAPWLPTVILLDLKLPRVDGLDVLSRIRAGDRLRRLPVVILISSTEQRDLAPCYDLGTHSCICKPGDFNQFAEAIRQLVGYWLVLNEPPPTG
jgi:CheY-like chemotaxis protein